MDELRQTAITKLGIKPYEFEYEYTLRDIGYMVDRENDRGREQAEALRFHAFMIIASFGGEKNLKPTDLVRFDWDPKQKKEEPEISKEEWDEKQKKFDEIWRKRF